VNLSGAGFVLDSAAWRHLVMWNRGPRNSRLVVDRIGASQCRSPFAVIFRELVSKCGNAASYFEIGSSCGVPLQP
jgi:hypothetical protein